jgi:hypothetical protein
MALIETIKNTVRNVAAVGALATAREALAQTERQIVDLEAKREQKLTEADGDYLSAVAAIDQQIVNLRAKSVVHRDRIAAMDIRRANQEHAQRQQERAAFIGELKKTFPKRQAAAARLDAALKEIPEAFRDLEAADKAIFVNWPELLPPADRYVYLRAMRIEPFSSTRKHRGLMAGFVRELVNRGPYDFAAEIEKRGRELIQELEGISVPENENAA